MSRAEGDAADSKRRRLATELRTLRELNGVSGRELARRIGISQSKLSRIEVGTALPSIDDVTAWAEAVGASDETQGLLERLTDAARTEVETWRDALVGRPHHLQDDIGRLEATASRARGFQPCMVPGLLQTSEYAQRVFSMLKERVPRVDVPKAVAGRMDRQLALYEEDKEFEFLITDAALRWRPGSPRPLLPQLDRIAQLSTKSNVSIGVIPLLHVDGTTPIMNPFTIIETKAEDSAALVLVETYHAGLTLRAPDDVAMHEEYWSELRRMAKFDDEARAYLSELSAEVRAVCE